MGHKLFQNSENSVPMYHCLLEVEPQRYCSVTISEGSPFVGIVMAPQLQWITGSQDCATAQEKNPGVKLLSNK